MGVVEQNRRPARDLIVAVLENMRRNLEPLRYSTIARSRYLVHLHPAESNRREGRIPNRQEQTTRALAEWIGTLTRAWLVRKYSGRSLGQPDVTVQSAAGDWRDGCLPDPAGDGAEGDRLIVSGL